MRRLSALLFLLPIGVSSYEVAAHFLVREGVATPREWDAAAEVVRRGKRPGDLVVAAPHWIRQTAYMHLGDRIVPLRDAARADTSTYRRLWVVSVRGANAPEAAGRTPEVDQRLGRVRVRRFALPPPANVVHDFLERIGDARVTLEGTGAAQACPWTPPGRLRLGRHVCDPRHAWNRVSERVMDDLRHQPRRAIWSHPVRGKKTVIRFDDVPLGSVLRGYTGLGYEAARLTGDFPPVRLDVFVDDVRQKRVVHRQRDVWKPFELDTRTERGTRADVRFEVSARAPGMRHFYFVADTRDP